LRKFFVLMERILSGRTKAYIAVSEALKVHMIEQMGVPEEKSGRYTTEYQILLMKM